MPMCRRKRVVLVEPSNALLLAARANSAKEIFYLEQTGEIFEHYDAYAARMSFYKLKQFQCEVTGKSGMNYFEALKSELAEGRIMHKRFPEPLKSAVLRSVQWQVVGRLDHLVEAVYDRFKDRYFKGERIYVDLQGDKFFANVIQLFPPRKPATNGHSIINNDGDSISAPPVPNSVVTEPNTLIHNVVGDLKIPAKEAMADDDPAQYLYKIQITEDQSERSHEKSRTSSKDRAKWSGSLMDVTCSVMSRDRLTFSKSILRRFIRDCVDRDAAVASPWTVKPTIAKRFGVKTDMPENTKKSVEYTKQNEMDKRKKFPDEKDGPLQKKPRKLTAAQQEKADKREREALEKAEKLASFRDEAERIAAEKKKKKPLRYPTEDMDVILSERDKKAGLVLRKPAPSRVALPFGGSVRMDAFLFGWNFLNIYGGPLHLSSFTMDEYENALRHVDSTTPCSLLAELHSSLIYNLRTVPFQRHSAVISLLRKRQLLESDDDDIVLGMPIDQLTGVISDIGNNWERAPLRVSETRWGWEDSLIGCLKDHATLENFPRMREIMTQLLFAPEPSIDAEILSTAASRDSTPDKGPLVVRAQPMERYYDLSPADRVEIIAFMCNQAVNSKSIHSHMEQTEEQLTALRKEKVEANRLKKQLSEEVNATVGNGESYAQPVQLPLPAVAIDESMDDDFPMPESSDLSDVPSEVDGDFDGGSETASATSAAIKTSSRQKDLRQKIQREAHAKQREAARVKVASAKQALAEHRRADEELNKVEQRLEAIEREFRQLLGAIRCKPLGKDRFFNRFWWFDGMGSASLINNSGNVVYGSGRLFVQGPNELDEDVLSRRPKGEVITRRTEEEGLNGILGIGEWSVYTDLEELEELVTWLNPKGVRELALKNALTKWWPHIATGIRKRISDINSTTRLPDARRSSRSKGQDVSREPYMLWTNRRALNVS